MNCQDCQDLLPLYATGSLDPAEAAAVRAHLATGCPACAAELAALEATLHKVPLGLPLQQAPASAWDKLETRIALKDQSESPHEGASNSPDRTALAVPFTRRGPSLFAWTGWAAAAVLLIALGLSWRSFIDDRHRLSEEIFRLSDIVRKSDELQDRFAKLEQQMKSLSDQNRQLADESVKRQTQVDSLLRSDQFAVTSPLQPNASGKLYWDKTTQTWQIYLGGVKPLDAGKTYELWIVSGTDKLAAGTAQADDQGRLSFQTTRKIPEGASLAAITDESAPGELDNGAKGQIQFLAKLTN